MVDATSLDAPASGQSQQLADPLPAQPAGSVGQSAPDAAAQSPGAGGAGEQASATDQQQGQQQAAAQLSEGAQAYLQGRDIPEDDAALHTSFANFADRQGLSAKAVHAAFDFRRDMLALNGKLPAEPRNHGYSLAYLDMSPEDLAVVNAFGNRMAKAGASESEFFAALRYYGDVWAPAEQRAAKQERSQAATDARQLDAMDTRDRNAARVAMQSEWGPQYRENIGLLNRWLDSLPDETRENIEREADENGRLALNNPQRLREFLHLAREKMGPQQSTQRTTQSSERTAAKPGDKAAIDAEIASIENLMRTNRRAYNRDERIQARYRELLNMRG